jgi:hypothetical protein
MFIIAVSKNAALAAFGRRLKETNVQQGSNHPEFWRC